MLRPRRVSTAPLSSRKGRTELLSSVRIKKEQLEREKARLLLATLRQLDWNACGETTDCVERTLVALVRRGAEKNKNQFRFLLPPRSLLSRLPVLPPPLLVRILCHGKRKLTPPDNRTATRRIPSLIFLFSKFHLYADASTREPKPPPHGRRTPPPRRGRPRKSSPTRAPCPFNASPASSPS